MVRYLFRRVLFSLLTLCVVSLLVFGISQLSNADPVASILNKNDDVGTYDRIYLNNYKALSRRFGLDKAVFYFSIAPMAYPDTLYRIIPASKRRRARKLIAQTANWPLLSQFQKDLSTLQQLADKVGDTLRYDPLIRLNRALKSLSLSEELELVSQRLYIVDTIISGDKKLATIFTPTLTPLAEKGEKLQKTAFSWSLYIPKFRWYGAQNQYHHWIKSMLNGEMGISYIERRPVIKKLKDAIPNTLLINGLALLFAFLVAIPAGVYAAIYPNSWFDRLTTVIMFFFFSLPSFWIATLCLVFLTNPQYGMDWFPAMGLKSVSSSASSVVQLMDTLHHLVLPVFCLGIGIVAFIARQMKNAIEEVLQEDYIRTARAKGLKQHQIIWQHSFKNALFPIITILASILPALVAGSVIIEEIFNIPGMGKATLYAITQRDWPVVYAVVMIGALLTVIGILLADLLYAWVDPRVKLDKK